MSNPYPTLPGINLIQPGTENQWTEYFKLRWLLLRKPWGQPPGSETDERDCDAYHQMATHGQYGAVGVGRIHTMDEEIAQIRYMAVIEKLRGQGIGTLILTALERHAISCGLNRIFLNARESAVNFYQQRQYQVVGDAPLLFGTISHKKMIKLL